MATRLGRAGGGKGAAEEVRLTSAPLPDIRHPATRGTIRPAREKMGPDVWGAALPLLAAAMAAALASSTVSACPAMCDDVHCDNSCVLPFFLFLFLLQPVLCLAIGRERERKERRRRRRGGRGGMSIGSLVVQQNRPSLPSRSLLAWACRISLLALAPPPHAHLYLELRCLTAAAAVSHRALPPVVPFPRFPASCSPVLQSTLVTFTSNISLQPQPHRTCRAAHLLAWRLALWLG